MDLAQTLGIAANTAAEDLLLNTAKLTSECAAAEDHVDSVILQGPGSLSLPAEGDCCAICSVELIVHCFDGGGITIRDTAHRGITASDDGS